MMCAVFPRSIFETRYATAAPVTTTVPTIRTVRLPSARRSRPGGEAVTSVGGDTDIGQGDVLLGRSCRRKAYSLDRGLRPRKRLVPGRSEGEDCAGPVGRAAQGLEDVAGLPVDAREGDSAQPLRQLDRVEPPRRRREEPQRSPSGAGIADRRNLPGRERPAEGGPDRKLGERDPRDELCKLGVVPAAEPRRDLDYLGPTPADAENRQARPRLDAERGDRTPGHLRSRLGVGC